MILLLPHPFLPLSRQASVKRQLADGRGGKGAREESNRMKKRNLVLYISSILSDSSHIFFA
jgi:hypothetical protein